MEIRRTGTGKHHSHQPFSRKPHRSPRLVWCPLTSARWLDAFPRGRLRVLLTLVYGAGNARAASAAPVLAIPPPTPTLAYGTHCPPMAARAASAFGASGSTASMSRPFSGPTPSVHSPLRTCDSALCSERDIIPRCKSFLINQEYYCSVRKPKYYSIKTYQFHSTQLPFPIPLTHLFGSVLLFWVSIKTKRTSPRSLSSRNAPLVLHVAVVA